MFGANPSGAQQVDARHGARGDTVCQPHHFPWLPTTRFWQPPFLRDHHLPIFDGGETAVGADVGIGAESIINVDFDPAAAHFGTTLSDPKRLRHFEFIS